ncbi:MAG: hypothetical protein KUG81_04545 [Gammaproteobacteria bacterium]|nr:hypothetical protein [Gammaproteobacteria bacterium]
MMNRLKVLSFKILLYAFVVILWSTAPSLAKDKNNDNNLSPILDMVKKKDKDTGKRMKSTSFTTSPKKKDDKDDSEEENKPELEDIEEADLDESLESIIDEENTGKSAEQKLWDAYKAMKAKTASKKEKDNKDNKSKTHEEEETEEEETESKEDDKKNSGLTKVIEDYKKSQKGKGGLNSRSFGSID